MLIRPPDFYDRVAELHAEGCGRNKIARSLKVSTRQVDKAARARGLSFDSARTYAAARARRSSAAQDREDLSTEARALAAEVMDRAHAVVEDPLELRRYVLVVVDLVNVDHRLGEMIPPVLPHEDDPQAAADEELAELSRMIGMKRRAVAR